MALGWQIMPIGIASSLLSSGVYLFGVGRRISHDFRNGGSFFLPGNDSLYVHTYNGESERIWGCVSLSSLKELDATAPFQSLYTQTALSKIHNDLVGSVDRGHVGAVALYLTRPFVGLRHASTI